MDTTRDIRSALRQVEVMLRWSHDEPPAKVVRGLIMFVENDLGLHEIGRAPKGASPVPALRMQLAILRGLEAGVKEQGDMPQ